MSAHTPGPWTTFPRGGNRGVDICHSGNKALAVTVHDPEENDDANSNLIAAAPDLLAALKSIAEGCSFPENDVQRAIRDRARAAISKAEGRAE